MNIGVIILVRFNSSRLPGKALIEIRGKRVLEYIIERLERVVSKDNIILATSLEDSDKPLVEFAREKQIQCYTGSLNNVADRFYEAARVMNCDYAVRINGDNVFLDTKVLANVLDIIHEEKYDFISNVKGRTFPKGMSVEAVRVSFYKELLPEINKHQQYQEHVTLYLYDHEPEKFYELKNDEFPEAAGIQLALDTQEDLIRTRNLIESFELPHWNYNLPEIMNLINNIES